MVDNIFGIWLQDLVSFGNPPAALIYYSVCGLDRVYDHFIWITTSFVGTLAPSPHSPTHLPPFPTASVYDVLQQLSMNSTAANNYNTCNTDQPTTRLCATNSA